jgi:mono/diheme cytochrome c family protein
LSARRSSTLVSARRELGQRLFRDKADCQSCHGINGDGRGDPRSPGRAANLHETRLDREQLIEVIACGRPGTEMPHFDKYAYEYTNCYGLKGKDLGSNAPRYPHSTPLTRREIEAVADYITLSLRNLVMNGSHDLTVPSRLRVT